MEETEEIKRRINIVDFINEFVPLKKAGRNFKALCPFHAEKTPSFIVSPERQTWHCFGGCQEGGDILKFLMKWENIDFLEALRILAKKAGVKLTFRPEVTERERLKERIYEINHLTSEFYHYLLLNHPSGKLALKYVLDRGLTQEALKLFKLGYAPNLWEGLIKYLAKKGYSYELMDKAGLIIPSESGGFYDRFRGRLIFTLKDNRGNVVGFSGRILQEGVKEAKYINTPETPVYIKGNLLYGLDITREAIKKEGAAVIVEGEFDLLSSYQAGVENVVAIKGSALTEGQVALLRRYTENILLSLDMDLAGDAAARRGIEIADGAGLNIKVVMIPVGKDPDECIRKDPNLWKKSLDEAVPVFDFIIDSASSRFDSKTAEGKRKISEDTLPFLAKIANPVVQSHYLKALSQKLEVSEEGVGLALRQYTEREKTPFLPSPPLSPKVKREQLLEEYLLSLILKTEGTKEFVEIFKTLSEEDFSSPPLGKIWNILSTVFAKEKKFKIQKFCQEIPKELLPIVDRLYLAPLGEATKKEIEATIKEIKKLYLQRKIKELSTKVREEENLDKKSLKRLSEELKSISLLLKENIAVPKQNVRF